MYTRCIFCHHDLRANEAIEAFPVGRRLAIDAARGRLWVVCRRCERRNPTPFEERWEAIEQCERLFRDTLPRVSTANIGLARLREGLEPVRIGSPLRPEFAAWRYGDQFGRRRRRAIVLGAGVVAVGTTALVGNLAAGAVAGVGLPAFNLITQSLVLARRHRLVARAPLEDGARLRVQTKHVVGARIVRDSEGEGWSLQLPHSQGNATLRGLNAADALGLIMPCINVHGGSKRQVDAAVLRLERAGDPVALLRGTAEPDPGDSITLPVRPARRVPYFGPLLDMVDDMNDLRAAVQEREVRGYSRKMGKARLAANLAIADLFGLRYLGTRSALPGLAPDVRLALEMAVNEETERAAMQGELTLLEMAWRDAEEIAAIADNLTIPAQVEEELARMKRRARRS